MRNITFINAGAGSGKTYRLTTDLARKLTQEGIDPSQVILTTYTELAAAEFREKARKEILQAKRPDGALVDASVRIRCATQLDNAFIGTVHAISYRFIRKYWYLLNYGADIQTMSDQNQDFYMSQSISDIVTEDDRKVFREFREAFDIKDSWKHPYHLFWLPDLKGIVDKMEYYDIENTDESLRKSYETAEAIFYGMEVDKALPVINRYLTALRTRCEGILSDKRSGEKAQRIIDSIDEIGKVKSISDLLTNGIKEYLGIKEKDQFCPKKDGFYDSDVCHDAIDAYGQALISKDFLPVIKKYLETIFDLAVRWRKALVDYKQENHVISFDDMEKIFLTMLTEPQFGEVQRDIASNFRLLMVDEFQDSNPIQLKIFNRISELIAENGGHSIWVGDPKQAIYGFRGSDSRFIADILAKFQFSNDGSAVPEEGPDNLGTDQLLESWRSRPALVAFSNSIFLEPFRKSGLLDTQITLTAHYSAEEDTMGDEQALRIWRTEDGKRDPMARMLAKKIKIFIDSGQLVHHKECNKETGQISYRDIAVLCFSNIECNRVASALRKVGVPTSCEEDDLMQCLEVYLLKTLLLFMQNPSDKYLRAELAMLLDDATTEEILKDRIGYVTDPERENDAPDQWMDPDSDHPHAAVVARMEKFTKRYQRLSVYDTVVAVREELDLDNIVEKWGDATQRKHNLSTVVSLAKAYDEICRQMGLGSSILGFINFLTVTKPENKTDNAADTVKVLTYHRAKGLEWPVVILYQLWKDFNDEKDIAKKKFRGVNVFEKDDREMDVFERGHYITLFPSSIGGSGKSDLPDLMQVAITEHPSFEIIKSQAQEEALRLLYVGVTRAKDILVSMTAPNKDDDFCVWPKSLGIGEGKSALPFGDGHGEQLEELAESIYDDDGTDQDPQYRQTVNEPVLNDAPVRFLSPSTIDSFPNAFTKNEMVDESPDRIIDMNVFSGEPSDAVKGTCIHDIFASFVYGDYDGNVQRVTKILDNFGFPKRLLAEKERIIESANWLYDFLTKQYGPASRIEREYPLLYPLPTGQVLRGEMDLLWFFKGEDGRERCVLVDYKSFPGKRSELEAHTETYYAQLSAYNAALTDAGVEVADTLVYYPVQAHVRKLLR